MATDSRSSILPYHRRLFLLLLLFSWVLVVCFVAFQYSREKHFKADTLNAQLQLLNLRLLDALGAGEDPAVLAARLDTLRLTVIDFSGKVLYDSSEPAGQFPSHADRPEVVSALHNGTGYTIQRLSESTRQRYFYSAMRGDQVVIRTAAPYTHTLSGVLAADREFLYFMLGITLLMSVAGYFATRRLGHNISRLRRFAERAERGEQINDEDPFPHDELGEISNHLTHLYANLQRATADRDREHAQVLHQEQEKIRIKRQLTHNINHELKTPVAAIRGYLETLLNNPSLEEVPRQAFLEKGLAQTERLQRMLADISAITRMDEAQEQMQRERIVINDLIDEISADMQLLPAENRLRVNCSFNREVAVTGDASQLGSVFRNLTDNAIAYSGGRDIFIDLEAEDDRSYTIRFADNGIGIDEEHLSRIFERFYRIDTGRSRKIGGTGLGLAIVKHALLLHGGTIEARSRKQGGLEFRITLHKDSQGRNKVETIL